MSNNKYKVLVVEDEENICSLLSTVLEANGYKMITAHTCEEGKMMFLSHTPDLILLDLGLSDDDGLNFVKYAREYATTPIIVLSARTEERDKVVALDMGVNDYVTKPFGTAELLARMRAALRVGRSIGGEYNKDFVLGDLRIEYDKRRVTVGKNECNLTQTEYNILSLLSLHAGKVMTYTAIIRAIWGASDAGSTKKLQVNMANIRKKLGIHPGDNRYIINELGVGYRMCEQREQ